LQTIVRPSLSSRFLHRSSEKVVSWRAEKIAIPPNFPTCVIPLNFVTSGSRYESTSSQQGANLMVRVWLRSVALLITLSGSCAIGQSDFAIDQPTAPGAITLPGLDASLSFESPFTDGRPDRFWFRIEYLAAYLSGSRLPSLITASPPGTPRAAAGVLGMPGTQVLFGDESFGDTFRSGVRARLGGWLDDDREVGFEVSGLALSSWSRSFIAGSLDSSAIVSRPFFDATTGRANAELVSFPGVLAGVVAADPGTSCFYAADVACRKSLCRDCRSYLDVVAGYRYMQFGDSVRITEQLQPLVAGVPTGAITLIDDFGVGNQFKGGVIGVAAGKSMGNLSFDVQARLGIGETSRFVSIVGATQIASPGVATLNSPGGLLALPSNIGTYRSSDWSVVPDLDLKVGCQITGCARVVFGYSVLYWTGVARAAEQIDLAVNPTQLPPGTLIGTARPDFTLTRSNLLVQSFSVGIELRY
jgi:hypothetical protein